MAGAIGAVDGCCIKVVGRGEAYKRYYCTRKGFHCINLQAVCDSDRRIYDFSVKYPGSTGDRLAWLDLEACAAIKKGLIPDGYFFLGDAAYPNGPHLLTPLPGTMSDFGTHGDAYNFLQSSSRIDIECAFGELIRRWGVLWHPLEVREDRRGALISACIYLHNYCITERIASNVTEASFRAELKSFESTPPLVPSTTYNVVLKRMLTVTLRERYDKVLGTPIDRLTTGLEGGGRPPNVLQEDKAKRDEKVALVLRIGFKRPTRRVV
jgi:hypothetical protein